MNEIVFLHLANGQVAKLQFAALSTRPNASRAIEDINQLNYVTISAEVSTEVITQAVFLLLTLGNRDV